MKNKTVITNALVLVITLGLSMSCKTQSEDTLVNEEEKSYKAYVERRNEAFLQSNKISAYEGLANIRIPEDYRNRETMSQLIQAKDMGDLIREFPANSDWETINSRYKDFLSTEVDSSNSWYYEQLLARRALSIIFQENLTDNKEDIAYYLQLLLNHRNGAAYLISLSLEQLIGYWDSDRIREAAVQTLAAPARPTDEKLKEGREKGDMMLNKKIDQHLEGITKLTSLAQLSSNDE